MTTTTVKTFQEKEKAEETARVLSALRWPKVRIVTCQESPRGRVYYAIRSNHQWLMDNGEMH